MDRRTGPNQFAPSTSSKLGAKQCINLQVMVLTSSIYRYDHFIIWPSSVTLTFNLCEQMFQMALLLLEDNNCAKLFWNPCINVPVMAQTSSIYDHFDLYLTLWPWPFNLPKKNVSNGTSPPQGQQLCHTVLKSMHYCTSYGPDKSRWTHWCTDSQMHAHTPNKNCNNYVLLTHKRARQKWGSNHSCTEYVILTQYIFL